MCFELDSLPPIPVIRGAAVSHEDLVLRSADGRVRRVTLLEQGADVKAKGGKPYAIPAGASDHPLGGLGFASWAREVEAQEREKSIVSMVTKFPPDIQAMIKKSFTIQ